MRKADGVGAHFENHFQVFAMHFLGDGASDPKRSDAWKRRLRGTPFR